MATISDRVKKAWNAFRGNDPPRYYYGGSGIRPDRTRRRIQNERSIINSIYNRISVDCSIIDIKHARVDENGQYVSTIDDYLNYVLTGSANLDQSGRAFILDAVMSMLDEGIVAIAPIETTEDPRFTDSYEVIKARVCRIVEWFPKHIRVEAYNENTGRKEHLILEKRYTPIIENPFYSIMNEPNSTLQRLIRILNQIDRTNEISSSGKLDLIIQLPYTIKSELRQKQAESRLSSIETQLTGSPYGIAYIDGTERVIQLNRAVENNLWNQAMDLKKDLFNEMGLSQSIFDGTADEQTLLNYYNRTVEPILTALCEGIEIKWISKTARAQGQAIRFFRNAFKLVPVSQLAEIADKFTRNEILTSNEVRAIIGFRPSDDPRANELRNSNLNQNDVADNNMGDEIDVGNFKIK